MRTPIRLEPYNPKWANEFAVFKAHLETVLTGLPYITIEHIGSTSIPDIFAKPIIDVDIEISGPENLDIIRNALKKNGFFCIGECGIPGRYAFWYV
jgi:GrpB-like predicted nucleotidyltransferase (UPF0157 family)